MLKMTVRELAVIGAICGCVGFVLGGLLVGAV